MVKTRGQQAELQEQGIPPTPPQQLPTPHRTRPARAPRGIVKQQTPKKRGRKPKARAAQQQQSAATATAPSPVPSPPRPTYTDTSTESMAEDPPGFTEEDIAKSETLVSSPRGISDPVISSSVEMQDLPPYGSAEVAMLPSDETRDSPLPGLELIAVHGPHETIASPPPASPVTTPYLTPMESIGGTPCYKVDISNPRAVRRMYKANPEGSSTSEESDSDEDAPEGEGSDEDALNEDAPDEKYPFDHVRASTTSPEGALDDDTPSCQARASTPFPESVAVGDDSSHYILDSTSSPEHAPEEITLSRHARASTPFPENAGPKPKSDSDEELSDLGSRYSKMSSPCFDSSDDETGDKAALKSLYAQRTFNKEGFDSEEPHCVLGIGISEELGKSLEKKGLPAEMSFAIPTAMVPGLLRFVANHRVAKDTPLATILTAHPVAKEIKAQLTRDDDTVTTTSSKGKKRTAQDALGQYVQQANSRVISQMSEPNAKRIAKTKLVPQLFDSRGMLTLEAYKEIPLVYPDVTSASEGVESLNGKYSNQAAQSTVTPARVWGLSSFLPSAQSVTRFLPTISRRILPAISPMRQTRTITSTPSIADTETPRAEAKLVTALQNEEKENQRPVESKTPSTAGIGNSTISADSTFTSTARSSRRRHRESRSKRQLKGKDQKELLRKQEEDLKAGELAQLKKDEQIFALRAELDREKLEKAKLAEDNLKGKLSPEVIPNPPGGGFGMDLNYFGLDSDEDTNISIEVTPTPAIKKIGLGDGSANAATRDPPRALTNPSMLFPTTSFPSASSGSPFAALYRSTPYNTDASRSRTTTSGEGQSQATPSTGHLLARTSSTPMFGSPTEANQQIPVADDQDSPEYRAFVDTYTTLNDDTPPNGPTLTFKVPSPSDSDSDGQGSPPKSPTTPTPVGEASTLLTHTMPGESSGPQSTFAQPWTPSPPMLQAAAVAQAPTPSFAPPVQAAMVNRQSASPANPAVQGATPHASALAAQNLALNKARQTALKHKPQQPSRLRESSRLSTSTAATEAGDEEPMDVEHSTASVPQTSSVDAGYPIHSLSQTSSTNAGYPILSAPQPASVPQNLSTNAGPSVFSTPEFSSMDVEYSDRPVPQDWSMDDEENQEHRDYGYDDDEYDPQSPNNDHLRGEATYDDSDEDNEDVFSGRADYSDEDQDHNMDSDGADSSDEAATEGVTSLTIAPGHPLPPKVPHGANEPDQEMDDVDGADDPMAEIQSAPPLTLPSGSQGHPGSAPSVPQSLPKLPPKSRPSCPPHGANYSDQAGFDDDSLTDSDSEDWPERWPASFPHPSFDSLGVAPEGLSSRCDSALDRGRFPKHFVEDSTLWFHENFANYQKAHGYNLKKFAEPKGKGEPGYVSGKLLTYIEAIWRKDVDLKQASVDFESDWRVWQGQHMPIPS